MLTKNVNWSSLYRSASVHEAWLSFRDLSTSALDYVTPLKEVHIKHHSEPWINAEIRASIRERDSWLRQSWKDKHKPDNYSICTVSCVIKFMVISENNAKRHYMIDKIYENKDNPKHLWKYLKNLGYQSQ